MHKGDGKPSLIGFDSGKRGVGGQAVNVDNSSASIFRCSPQKIIEITLAFGLNNNKNVCKTFVRTKNHENM